VYSNFEEARAHVLARRDELRKAWESRTARQPGKTAKA